MTHLAVGYKTVEAPGQGRELKTDGYHKHIGGMDIGSLRVSSRAGHPALTGAGVETLYQPGGGTIQCFNRDTQLFEDLNIMGRNLTLSPQSGGSLILPPNCVGTSQLQANAVQQPLGTYQGGPPFALTSTNVWTETPVKVTITTGGGLLRIEYSTGFYHSAANGTHQVGLGFDGAVSIGLSEGNLATAGGRVNHSAVYYATLLAGTHTVAVFVINNTTGTLTLNGGINSVLYVTEQKR